MTINLEKSLVVQAPAQEIYERWADISSYAAFMPHVGEVKALEDGAWTWKMNGEAHRVEIMQRDPDIAISWRTSSPTFKATSSVRLTPHEDGSATNIVYAAHYPNGAGHRGIAELTTDMETCLAKFAALFDDPQSLFTPPSQGGQLSDHLGDWGMSGQTSANASAMEPAEDDGDDTAASVAFVKPDMAKSAQALTQTLSSATEAWAANMTAAFKQFNAMLWAPLGSTAAALANAAQVFSPSFELSEEGDALVIRSSLPGFTPDNIHVEVKNGQLLISGEREQVEEGDNAWSEEDASAFKQTQRTSFHKCLPLDRPIDSAQIEAHLTPSGQLQIRLPIKQMSLMA